MVVDAAAVDVADAVVVVAEPQVDAHGLGDGDLGVEERSGAIVLAQGLLDHGSPAGQHRRVFVRLVQIVLQLIAILQLRQLVSTMKRVITKRS